MHTLDLGTPACCTRSRRTHRSDRARAVAAHAGRPARALPTWAVWVSYAVAVLCMSGFWSGGMGSVAFALWLIGAVIGVLRAARRTTARAGVGEPA